MSDTYDVKPDLLAAFRSLMTPLIRILLRCGVTFRDFSEVMKEVYVGVCIREMSLPGRRTSLSRVGVTTGLPRREIARIVRGDSKLRFGGMSLAGLAASVLEVWHTEPKFLAPYGYPRDLQIDGTDEVPTFQDLVARFSSSVPYEVLLLELIRVGAAKVLDGGNYVRVDKRSYIPTDMTIEMIQIFSQAVRRYIETVDYNLDKRNSDAKRFDRVVYPNYGLRAGDLDAYKNEMRVYLEKVIEDIDQKTSAYGRPDVAGGEETVEVGVGLYFYEVQSDDKTPLEEIIGDVSEAALLAEIGDE